MGKSGCTPEPAEGILGWPAIGSRVARAAFSGLGPADQIGCKYGHTNQQVIKGFDPFRIKSSTEEMLMA